MPEDLMEHMYCSQQINIPPNLPYILKQYAKAAIRTQPYDLLYWSAAYFRAKANDTQPPVKDRLEYPPVDSPSRLSPGFLKVLHKQLGENVDVSPDILYEKWLGVCLVKSALDSMLKVGSFHGEVPWLKFIAIAAGHLCPTLSRTMVMICEVLTEEPEGGSAMIAVETFVDLYEWLAELDCGPEPPLPLDIPATPSSVPPSDLAADSHVSYAKEGESVVDVIRVGVTEKDSTAGLMVWPDVRPEEKTERLSSPKYTDELGATSELGIEVLDDATGIVTEVVTLYPAQPEHTSHETVETSVVADHISNLTDAEVGSNILSHSSLRENDDWIKATAYQPENESIISAKGLTAVEEKSAGSLQTEEIENVDDVTEEQKDEVFEPESKTATVPESKTATVTESKTATMTESKTATVTASKTATVTESKTATVTESKTKTLTDIEGSDKKSLAAEMPKETQSIGEVKSSDKTLKSTPSKQEGRQIGEGGPVPSAEELQEVEMKINSLQSADSLLGPGESITVQQFIRDDLEGSTVTYSTVEIRRDMVGESSQDQIERASSEDVVRAARTQHRVMEDKSSEVIMHEMIREKSASEKLSSESSSFTVLPEEEPWHHVPGIGPVIPKQQVLAVVEYMQYWAAKQHGMVMPRNINHILCPPLDLPPASASDQSLPQEY